MIINGVKTSVTTKSDGSVINNSTGAVISGPKNSSGSQASSSNSSSAPASSTSSKPIVGYSASGSPIYGGTGTLSDTSLNLTSNLSTPYSNQSTTTLSSDKSKDIASTANGIANMTGGVTTDANTGVSTYANGQAYDPATDTSNEDDEINKQLSDMLKRTDSETADTIQSISNKYTGLKAQQTAVNEGNTAATQGALFRSGAAQYDAYAGNTMSYQAQQNLNAMVALENDQQDAINQAKAAQAAGYQRVAEIKLQQAQDAKARKLDLADKINEELRQQQVKAKAQSIQASRDSAVAGLFDQGVKDVPTLLNYLNYDDKGNKTGDFTAEEVAGTLNKLTTRTEDTKDIQAIALEAAKNGASAEIIKAINAAANPMGAILAAGSSLTDTLGNQLKLAQIRKIQIENQQAIASANGNTDAISLTNDSTGQPLNVPVDVAPYVNFSSNGIAYLDGSSLQGTAKEKGDIIRQATKAGLKVITNKNTAADLINIKDANSKLDTISSVFADIGQPGYLTRDLGGAGLTDLAIIAQTDPKKAAAGALESVGLDMLKAISGSQGFRGGQASIAQITEHLPKVNDTQATVDQKISYLRQLISDREDAAVGKADTSKSGNSSSVIEYNGKQYKVDANGNMTAI